MESTVAPKQSKEGYEHVTEGYYKWADITFEWPKQLDPWHVSPLRGRVMRFITLPSISPLIGKITDISHRQANAVRAIICTGQLLHPDNPLRLSGDDGIRLYLGTWLRYDRAPKLMLKQVRI
jgi:hypothetical protein